MSDALEQIYTNKNSTVIITPPTIPLQETDIAWCRADRIEELGAERDALAEQNKKLVELLAVAKRAVRLSLDHSDFKLYAMEIMHQAIAAAELNGQDSACQATDPFDR